MGYKLFINNQHGYLKVFLEMETETAKVRMDPYDINVVFESLLNIPTKWSFISSYTPAESQTLPPKGAHSVLSLTLLNISPFVGQKSVSCSTQCLDWTHPLFLDI